MVGRETRFTYVHGLSATRWSFSRVVAVSGPFAGCASGTAPGHIDTWVCPGDGCHAEVCALRLLKANTTQRATIGGFITITKMQQREYRLKYGTDEPLTFSVMPGP